MVSGPAFSPHGFLLATLIIMPHRLLIVEDEVFIALEIERVAAEIGFEAVGIAADAASASRLADEAEFALVDVNLRDGQTGGDIGRELARRGIVVVFMTANPAQLGTGVDGTVGVLTKPVNENELAEALYYAANHRAEPDMQPPPVLKRFFGQSASG